MIFWPSHSDFQEILSCPQVALVSWETIDGKAQPTLIMRNSALLTRFMLKSNKVRLCIFLTRSRFLCYAVEIWDGSACPNYMWSVARTEDQKTALLALVSAKNSSIHLFNEACANIAGTFVNVSVSCHADPELYDGKVLIDKPVKIADEIYQILPSILSHPACWVDLSVIDKWIKNVSRYVGQDGKTINTLDFFDEEEGSQQEQLAKWLTDELSTSGSYHSPQIMEGAIRKELTDVLLSHEFGAIAIESKTISVLMSKELPAKEKLIRRSKKKSEEAFTTLKGVCRKIHGRVEVTDLKTKRVLCIERTYPIHAICLVPDLNLLHASELHSTDKLNEFGSKHSDMFQIIDTAQLFRLIQAAHIMSKVGNNVSRIAAFDFCLLKRWEYIAQNGFVDFDMTLDASRDPPRMRFESHE